MALIKQHPILFLAIMFSIIAPIFKEMPPNTQWGGLLAIVTFSIASFIGSRLHGFGSSIGKMIFWVIQLVSIMLLAGWLIALFG